VQVLSGGSSAALVTAIGFDNAPHPGGAAGTQVTLNISGKWDGAYGNALSIRPSAPVSGTAGRFDLAVVQAGLVVESWKDCSMTATDPNYVVTLVNAGSSTQAASKLISIADAEATFPSPGNLPAYGTFGPMSGGNDGLAALADIDFYGTQSPNGSTGLYALNTISRIDVVAVPGRCTAAVHGQTVTWCEIYREQRTFAVLAVPSGLTVAGARAYVTSTADLQGLSEIAAIYGPWIAQDNPLQSVFGQAATIIVPPEGAIMGAFSRVDVRKVGGAFDHPSNALGRLTTARGVETDEWEDDAKRGLAFDCMINAIRATRGKVPYIDGARCLLPTGSFPTVGQSRGAMLVTNNLIAAYDDLRNAGIRDSLYDQLAGLADVYLGKLADAGALISKDHSIAYFVDFGGGLNTPDVSAARTVLGNIGIGAPPPAEFIFVTLVPYAGLAQQFAQQVASASPGV